MTADKIRLVQDNYRALAESQVPVGSLFYARLFETAPAVRPMFKKDVTEQVGKFDKMLKYLVEGLAGSEAIHNKLESLGRAHKNYGAVEAHYHVVADVLVATLAEGLGTKFTPEAEAAWRELLAEVSEIMLNAPVMRRLEA